MVPELVISVILIFAFIYSYFNHEKILSEKGKKVFQRYQKRH